MCASVCGCLSTLGVCNVIWVWLHFVWVQIGMCDVLTLSHERPGKLHPLYLVGDSSSGQDLPFALQRWKPSCHVAV